MRQIGAVKNEQQAETLVAHLLLRDIESHVDQDNDVWEVWIKDEDRLDESKEELNAFLANPNDPKYERAIVDARQKLMNLAEARIKAHKKVVNVRDGFSRGKQYRAPITLALIVISCLVGIVTFFGDDFSQPATNILTFNAFEISEANAWFTSPVGIDNLWFRCFNISRGEIWRLVTPIFLHFGVMHLAFNLIWLYSLGRPIENRFGPWKYLLFILLLAAVSNFFEAAMPVAIDGHPPLRVPDTDLFVSAFGGMSGVVYGLFGFYWMRSTFEPRTEFFLPQSTVIFMVAWFLLGVSPFDSQLLGFSMANWAHGIGLALGMAVGYFSSPAFKNAKKKTEAKG